MVEQIKNYIGGEWVASRSGDMLESLNPATEEILATAPNSSADEVNAAVDAAREAYKSWRLTPAPRRGEILFRVAEVLKTHKEDLARLLTQEMGKVIAEARGDVQEAIDMAYYMGGEGRRLMGYTAPVEMPNKFGMALRDSV
ncbi:MAG: aldehyde dehydrogenase family protein, partial [Anaerolineae bacterium]|nr:aldehyde dehydrogenase family protein [Anaerolineae bacterium]